MSEGVLDDVSTISVPKRTVDEKGTRLVPALTILSHPDIQRVGERLLMKGLLVGEEVPLSRKAPEFIRPGEFRGQPLADPCLSRKPIVFAPGGAERVRLLVEEAGTQVVAGDPIRGAREFGPEELAAGIPLELAERVVLLLHLTEPETGSPSDTLGMVGQGAGIRRVREHIEQVADLKVPVLIRGETGTGKELVARAIHQRSRRRTGPFVSVNMAAIPKELAAAELFGSQKGAFTHATRDREGFFRAAQGGTLFLDEVGEAPPEVQVLLLRVLETGEMYPVGGHTPIAVDVRLVAATDANLEEQIRKGHFREPLMHRLAGYEVRLPPLRARREDIGPLFFHFAREELRLLGEPGIPMSEDPHAEPWLPAPLAAHLVRYAWPGNIRQLRNVTRQLVISNRGRRHLRLETQLQKQLGPVVTSPAPAPAPSAPPPEPEPEPKAAPPRRKPADISEQELLAALSAHAWDLKKAADQLGIPRSSIYDLIAKSPHIRTAGDLSPEEIARCYRECQGDVDTMVQRLKVSKQALRRRIRELGLDS
jgi:two-component system nitrogen regulation response regulator GlnG